MRKFSPAYKNMAMFFSVTFYAESYPIIYFIAKINVFRKGFDMMGVEGSASYPTFLANKIISLEYFRSPIKKLLSASGYFVLMRTINRMIGNSGFGYFSSMG